MKRGKSLRKSSSLADVIFYLVMSGLSSCFVLLIILLLVADLNFLYTSSGSVAGAIGKFTDTMRKPEFLAAFRLTMFSCTFATILSMLVAIPLGYLLSRYKFPGRWFVDTVVDIPIVLPPLVLGLSLLILFNKPIGGIVLEKWLQDYLGLTVSFRWPAVVLAQFAVACSFSIRTMRVTFDQIDARPEDVARTLGCNRAQAFYLVALPQAWRGMIAAATIAWARALGEFGPILVFAGSTRFRTEVLSTTVFLELSIGNLDAAVAVSLLMVAIAVVFLLLLRWLGTGV